MRIFRSQNSSLPPFDCLPSDKSWALEVEREDEIAQLHKDDKVLNADCNGSMDRKDSHPKRLKNSSREADQRSLGRESRKTNRSSVSKPIKSLLAGEKHAKDIKNDSWSHPGNISERSSRHVFYSSSRCYPPQSYSQSSQSHVTEKGIVGEHFSRQFFHGINGTGPQGTVSKKETEISSKTFSKPSDKSDHIFDPISKKLNDLSSFDNSRHTCSRETHASKLSEDMGSTRAQYTRVYDDKINRKSGHESFRRLQEQAGRKAETESNQGLSKPKLEGRSYHNKPGSREPKRLAHGQGDLKNIRRQSYEGNIGKEDHANVRIQEVQSCLERVEVSSKPNLVQHQVSIMQGDLERSVLALDDERLATSPRANEGNSNALGKLCVQGSSIKAEGMMEVSDYETEAKEDDSLDTKKQYEMLASLILDDSLDIDQDFDETHVPEGLDLGFCGSIFGDDLELPDSMDADVHETKNGVFVKLDDAMYAEGTACGSVLREQLKGNASVSDPDGKPPHKCREVRTVLSPPTVFIDVTNKFEFHAAPVVKREAQEDDAHRLSQRQRQIEFGKNTLGYERYIELVPRCKRKARDPQTPNPKQVCSKRSWDGQIRKWRRLLHVYDPPVVDGEEIAEDLSTVKSDHGHIPDATDEDTRDVNRLSVTEKKYYNASENMRSKTANLTIFDDWMES